jgi:hypothetical protein
MDDKAPRGYGPRAVSSPVTKAQALAETLERVSEPLQNDGSPHDVQEQAERERALERAFDGDPVSHARRSFTGQVDRRLRRLKTKQEKPG